MNSSSRTHARRRRVFALVVLGAAGAIALVACGGSSDSSSSKTTTSTAKKGAASTPVVKTANSSLGTIVVTNDGKTVYTLTSGGQQVPCSSECRQVWPPVTVVAPLTKATGTGVQNVGTGAGGEVTINGAPVYTYVADTKAGDTKGEGIVSFGGTWNVVKASG